MPAACVSSHKRLLKIASGQQCAKINFNESDFCFKLRSLRLLFILFPSLAGDSLARRSTETCFWCRCLRTQTIRLQVNKSTWSTPRYQSLYLVLIFSHLFLLRSLFIHEHNGCHCTRRVGESWPAWGRLSCSCGVNKTWRPAIAIKLSLLTDERAHSGRF